MGNLPAHMENRYRCGGTGLLECIATYMEVQVPREARSGQALLHFFNKDRIYRDHQDI